MSLFPLVADQSSEYHADWLEIATLESPQGFVSRRDFIDAISETKDSLPEHETAIEIPVDERCEALANDAFAEVEERFYACGGEEGTYPFRIERKSLVLHTDRATGVYAYLLLLSYCDGSVGSPGTHTERVFEDVSACAAASYLGGRAHVFGFPRRVLPKGFEDALVEMCKELGEGSDIHPNATRAADAKDDGLDVVAWKDFYDRRRGKLIGFGQCATGTNWETKLWSLTPHRWCQNWMADPPVEAPVRMFFVPHRVDFEHWRRTCIHGGILFDRCRIASCVRDVDSRLKQEYEGWTAHVLKKLRQGDIEV